MHAKSECHLGLKVPPSLIWDALDIVVKILNVDPCFEYPRQLTTPATTGRQLTYLHGLALDFPMRCDTMLAPPRCDPIRWPSGMSRCDAISMFFERLRSRCDAMRFQRAAMRCKSELESESESEYKSQSEKTKIAPMWWFAM